MARRARRPAHSGAKRVGSARSTVALPSPSGDHAGWPPLRTSSGLAPKYAGFQSTMSARRPGRSEPTWSATPWVMAGSIVTLAR